MKTKFLIIGAQKSASTYLQKCLSDHPEIYMQRGENPFFEDPIYDKSNINILYKSFENSKKCVGIKRPNYLGKEEVPARVEMHLPNAKLIAVLRNPIDRAISAYFFYIKTGFLPPLNINDGIEKILFDKSFNKKYKRGNEIIEFGLYFKYLSKYDYFKNNNQLLVLLHDDVKKKPLESIKKVYNFLNVDENHIPRALDSKPKEGIYSLCRIKFMMNQNIKIFKHYASRGGGDMHTNIIDKYIYKIKYNIDNYILSRVLSNVKPIINYEIKKNLSGIYKNDIELLENYLDINLKNWKNRF